MKIITLLLLATFSSISFGSDQGGGSYTIELDFDIEGSGYEKTAIFISGYSYGLALNASALESQGKANYFCKEGSVDHKEVLDILNANLSGIVSADLVAETATRVLKEKYPCK